MTVENAHFDAYQGADLTINFTIYDADGFTATNITGWTLSANFAPVNTANTDEDLHKTIGNGIAFTVAASGTGAITLLAAVTQEMDATDWEYDLWRTNNGSTYPLSLGSFTLLATPRSRSSDT